MKRKLDFEKDLNANIADFIASMNSFYLATASKDGKPYIQHRGGPPGFLKVLGPHTLAFADFAGNRQYLSIGNLAENDAVFIFLMDYAHRQRVKIWGRAKVDNDPELLKQLAHPTYKARIERAIVIEVDAWDVNCPAHIPQMLPAADVAEAINKRDARIHELEARVAELEHGKAA